MQRTRTELEGMSRDDLVDRILEMQDMLREGLAVRDSLHAVLNTLLKAKADEVEHFASVGETGLELKDLELRKAWAQARHAVSNPYGLLKKG
jgi:hypothetical protein